MRSTRLASTALFLSATLLAAPLTLSADDADHPFGARPDRDAPLGDDPFARPFNGGQINSEGAAPTRPTPGGPTQGERSPLEVFNSTPFDTPLSAAEADKLWAAEADKLWAANPFASLPQEAFRPRGAEQFAAAEPVRPADASPEFVDVMEFVDLDGDGRISDAEVGAATDIILRDSRARNERGEQIRQKFDLNGDGVVDRQEVETRIAQQRMRSGDRAVERVVSMFRELDTDGSGSLTALQFMQVAARYGIPPQIASPMLRNQFAALDRNRDGSLSLEEAVLAADAITGNYQFGRGRVDEAALARAWEVMEELDRNNDNELSRLEARRNPSLLAAFDQIDADGSDSLSLPEMYEFLRAFQPRAGEQDDWRARMREAWDRRSRGVERGGVERGGFDRSRGRGERP